MPTGDTKVELVLKRFLSENRLDANFLAYLRSEYLDLGSRIFPVSGLFTYPVTITPDWVANDFDLTPDPLEGIDNAGHVIKLDGRGTNITFENTLFDVYYLGMKYIEAPEGVYTNPRSGIPEYDKIRNEVGEKDEPNLVVDNLDGTITFVVNDITQAGIDHGGRSVTVWLKNPMVVDAAVAIETRTIAYVAPDNTITTVGSLGQSTISVDPNDYYVACFGVTVKNVGTPAPIPSPFGDEYIQLGYIIGGGGGGVPGSVSTAEQIDLSGGGGHTLQKAYDGLAGNGSGRLIVVQDEAVLLRQESTAYRSEDIANSAIRIRKDIPTSLYGVGYESEGGIDIASRFRSNYGIMVRSALNDMTVNDELRIEEDVDILDANTVSFTRAGVDLTLASSTHSNLQVGDLVEITGSILGNDGVFSISVINATTLDCVEMSRHEPPATSPGWVAEAGLKARIFRPRVMIHPKLYSLVIKGINDFYREVDPGGMLNAGQIDIDLTANASNDDMFIRCVSGARYIKLTALGNIIMTGDITCDDIDCDDITADTITFDAGVTDAVDMNGRHINMNGGNIDMKNGEIKNTLGNVEVNDVLHVSGSIFSDLNVAADNDVIADYDGSGVGEFEYGVAKTYKKYLTPDEGMFDASPVAPNCTYYEGDDGTTSPNFPYLVLVSSPPAKGKVTFPVRLPIGATITRIRAKINQSVANAGKLELHSWLPEWAEGVPPNGDPNDRVLLGAQYTNANADNRIINSGVVAHTIANDRMYTIYFETSDGAVATTTYLYWIEINYTLDTLKECNQ